jgi:undecaprenyl phosphate-alpha-L-ara4FN deformylase
MRLGLRIDVDTFRGTRDGVPNLLRLLADHSIRATFFFCVGPDNMGRYIWRLLRPAFLWKMLRTRAPSLYGWDILLRGTLGPGPVIGDKLAGVIRSASDAGHEVGLHAWDHYAWQAQIDAMDREAIRQTLRRGVEVLTRIMDRHPAYSAAPAWKANDRVLEEKSLFPFVYNSDCRGESIFCPLVDGRELSQPQIPVTLPTFDEVVGREGVRIENYNDHLLSLLRPERLNVLTIHAEVEGITFLELLHRFLKLARQRGVECIPLGTFLRDSPRIPVAALHRCAIPGREGWIARQAPAIPSQGRD